MRKVKEKRIWQIKWREKKKNAFHLTSNELKCVHVIQESITSYHVMSHNIT